MSLSSEIGQPIELDRFTEEKNRHGFHLPYSTICEPVPSLAIYQEALTCLPMERSAHIKSLALIGTTKATRGESNRKSFLTDRLLHSVGVGILASGIMRRNGFPETIQTAALIQGLSHDIATPAAGDATKKVDPDNLDEETHWDTVMTQDSWDFFERQGIEYSMINDAIHGQGTMGKVLDIADRITYVMQDLESMSNAVDGPYPHPSDIAMSIETLSPIGNLFTEVKISPDREVYFENPERLKRFLLLRSYLWRDLYRLPENQGRDLLFKRLIEPIYAADGSRELSPDRLRTMTDDQLFEILYNHYDIPFLGPLFFETELAAWEPNYLSFDTEEEAQIRASILSANKDVAVIGVLTQEQDIKSKLVTEILCLLMYMTPSLQKE